MPDSNTYGYKSEKKIKAEHSIHTSSGVQKNCLFVQHSCFPRYNDFLGSVVLSIKRKKLPVLVIGSQMSSVTQSESEHSPPS